MHMCITKLEKSHNTKFSISSVMYLNGNKWMIKVIGEPDIDALMGESELIVVLALSW